MNIYIQIEKKRTKYLRRQIWQINFKYTPPFPEDREIFCATEKYSNRTFVLGRCETLAKYHNFLVKDFDGSILFTPSKQGIGSIVYMLINAMENDEGYRRSWVGNIAMAFKDGLRSQLKKENKRFKSMNQTDLHVAANAAANNFIDSLIGLSKPRP